MLLSLKNISLNLGRTALLDKANLTLEPGERLCLMGRNGAGKSTLLKVIAGEVKVDGGEIVTAAQGLKVAQLPQDVPKDLAGTVYDVVADGLGEVGHLIARYHHLISEGAEDLAELSRVQSALEAQDGWALESRVEAMLSRLKLDGDVPFASLSGGVKRRALLGRALVCEPDLLLLDEPTNHLDIESIVWLERFLRNSTATILMTSHDRDFMNRVVTRIAAIDDGEIVSYSGNYDFYEREYALRDANREAAFARQQAMLAKEQRFIDRFAAHAAKAAQVQSRVKALEKIEKIELPKKRQIVKFDFRPPPRSGDDVAVIERLGKRYGSRVIYDDFNLTIRRGERWSVMGRNGAGKTTLLRMIAGAIEPDSGQVRLGASLKMGYFAQQALQVLQADLTVWEQIQSDFPHDSIGVLRNLLGAFQFSGDDVEKKIRSLSGGERSRLVLARMLFNPPNFLVLDEPTNHLDLATKDMLIEALSDFEGTMIFVSHDRSFLRGLSNRVLELGGETGTSPDPVAYLGSYVEYVARSGHEAPGVHA